MEYFTFRPELLRVSAPWLHLWRFTLLQPQPLPGWALYGLPFGNQVTHWRIKVIKDIYRVFAHDVVDVKLWRFVLLRHALAATLEAEDCDADDANDDNDRDANRRNDGSLVEVNDLTLLVDLEVVVDRLEMIGTCKISNQMTGILLSMF